MKKYYKRIYRRNDNKNILLFNLKEHKESNLEDIFEAFIGAIFLDFNNCCKHVFISLSVGLEQRIHKHLLFIEDSILYINIST